METLSVRFTTAPNADGTWQLKCTTYSEADPSRPSGEMIVSYPDEQSIGDACERAGIPTLLGKPDPVQVLDATREQLRELGFHAAA